MRIAATAVAALVTVPLALGPAALPAGAATSLPASPVVTATPNDRVTAVVRVGGTIYLGGSFTSVRRLDGTSVTRRGLAGIDASSGDVTSWNPDADGAVLALAASADGRSIYAGGDFNKVGGRSRAKVVKLSAATGSVSSFKANASSTVRALLVNDTKLYIGGTFSTINGTTVNRLARVSASTGTVSSTFKPSPDAGVRSLALAPDGTKLYVAGSFTTIGGASRRNLAAVSPSSGSARSFNPSPSWAAFSVGVSADGTRVYAGGAGTGGRLAAWKASSTKVWEVTFDGDVNSLAVTGSTVYAGGHFHQASTSSREKLAAFDRATGALDPWAPQADSITGVYTVVANPDRLHVGGDFTRVGGVAQARYAQFRGTLS